MPQEYCGFFKFQYLYNVTNQIWCRICTIASTGKLMISLSACSNE